MLLTTGSRLPPEIAERVFEFALEVEDIPSHPSVKEKIVVDFSKIFYGRRIRRSKVRPRSFVRTKSLYRCEGFDLEDEDDMFWTDDDEDDDADYELIELQGTFMDFTNIALCGEL